MNNGSAFTSWKAFLFSFLSAVKINVVGQLAVGEIFVLIESLSFKKWRLLYKQMPDLVTLNITYSVFLVFQILSDIVNQSPFSNSARGWANIAMAILVTNFLSRVLWKSDGQVIVLYLLGDILRLTFWGPVESEGLFLGTMQFYKFRLAPILNDFVLIISFYLLGSRRSLSYTLPMFLLAYGLFNMAMDYRSNGIFFVIAAIIYFSKNTLLKINLRKSVPYLLFFAIVFQGLYSIYVSEVLDGNIGGTHSLVQIKRIENPYNPLNLIITGRAETVASFTAISDKPVFGHGSWAPDPGGKYTFLTYKLHNEEDKFEAKMNARSTDPIIPSHSVILGAWVSAGFIGFLTMCYALYFVMKRAFTILRDKVIQQSKFFPTIIFFVISTAWNFLFSPLSHLKLTLPIMIALTLVMYQKSYNRKKATKYTNKKITYGS